MDELFWLCEVKMTDAPKTAAVVILVRIDYPFVDQTQRPILLCLN